MVRIMVVDDDLNTRLLMKAILEKENYEVFLASDGKEGLYILDHNKIDLAIVDIMMPNIDGYQFTKIIRQNDDSFPILMLTAKHLPEDRKKGFLVGTDDYMIKPVDEEEMLLRIKALLRRAKIVSEKQIRMKNVIIDYNSFTVTKDDIVIELPQKEFELLFKLLSYPNKIFTRIQLMDDIWGYDTDTGWETVTVHISRLRKKFDGWPEFTIEAVRGLGYKAVKHDE